ncbi:hypothetical protein PybrP1_011153 [[Pythium] brassicae (nom. inval.)]|nr:hypothetical protein PybrP1_011153 [[Pythium] brassicae (nom. inval.)]
MFSLARDDVVTETQTADFDMQSADASTWRCRWRRPRSPLPAASDSPTTAALVQAEALPALSLVVPPDAAETAAFNNAHAMQRLRLQTPRKSDAVAACWSAAEGFVAETPTTAAKHARPAHGNKRPRSASPASPVSSMASSTCASAVALARKRALKDSGRVRGEGDRGGGAMCEESAGVLLDCDGDDEVLLPRVMSFVEYDAAELDHLVIAPSQDYFDGDDEARDDSEAATQPPKPRGFVEFQDLSQWNDECSEVFDDVIDTPRHPPSPNPPMPPIREQVRLSPSQQPPTSVPRAKDDEQENNDGDRRRLLANHDGHESDSESSLSDGFDISRVISSRRSVSHERMGRSGPRQQQPHHRRHKEPPQWCERRSVKRDCSFLETENQCASPAREDGKCRRARAVSRIEELKLDCVDSGDDSGEPTKLDTGGGGNDATDATDDDDDFAAASSSSTSSRVFQPRLLKKRRKGRQLGLDAFFRARPCM